MCWQSPCAHLNVIISNLGGCPKDYNGDNTTHQRLEVPLTIFKNGTIEKSTSLVEFEAKKSNWEKMHRRMVQDLESKVEKELNRTKELV
jgi:hypothetical protein